MLSCCPTPESFCFVPPTNLHLSIKSGQDVGIKLRPPQPSSSSYHHRKNFSSSSSFQKLQKERTFPILHLPSPPQLSFHGPGSAVVRPPLPVPYSSPNPRSLRHLSLFRSQTSPPPTTLRWEILLPTLITYYYWRDPSKTLGATVLSRRRIGLFLFSSLSFRGERPGN